MEYAVQNAREVYKYQIYLLRIENFAYLSASEINEVTCCRLYLFVKSYCSQKLSTFFAFLKINLGYSCVILYLYLDCI